MNVDNQLDPIQVCAFCPSACRRAIDPALAQQVETRLPSSLALLIVLVRQGVLEWEAGLAGAWQDLQVATACASACTYGYDMAALIRQAAKQMEPSAHG